MGRKPASKPERKRKRDREPVVVTRAALDGFRARDRLRRLQYVGVPLPDDVKQDLKRMRDEAGLVYVELLLPAALADDEEVTRGALTDDQVAERVREYAYDRLYPNVTGDVGAGANHLATTRSPVPVLPSNRWLAKPAGPTGDAGPAGPSRAAKSINKSGESSVLLTKTKPKPEFEFPAKLADALARMEDLKVDFAPILAKEQAASQEPGWRPSPIYAGKAYRLEALERHIGRLMAEESARREVADRSVEHAREASRSARLAALPAFPIPPKPEKLVAAEQDLQEKIAARVAAQHARDGFDKNDRKHGATDKQLRASWERLKGAFTEADREWREALRKEDTARELWEAPIRKSIGVELQRLAGEHPEMSFNAVEDLLTRLQRPVRMLRVPKSLDVKLHARMSTQEAHRNAMLGRR